MEFKAFKNEDAEFCFKTRSAAFIEKFYDELGPDIVALCVNAYMPGDYINFSKSMNIFIAEDSGEEIGFVTVKRIDTVTAEIPLVYFKLDKLGKGYGSRAMEFIEDWVKTNWKEVKKIFLDTIIPMYNGGFYLRVKYNKIGESTCTFSGRKVKAVRFEKHI
jgi:GNAT superfamily N-acetyltransferase